MCFGGKNERSDDPPPRAAQNYQGQSDYQSQSNYQSQSHRPNNTKDTKMTNFASNNPYNNQAGSSASGQQQYAPPPGPPPSQQQRQQPQDDFAPPSGPPPSHNAHQQDEYAPPPGPPPSKGRDNTGGIAPPEYDPSSAPPQHNWQAVPDTSLFPPPPAIFSGYDQSPANNATEDEAAAGEAWCAQHLLTEPMQLDAAGDAALRAHNFCLVEPAGFRGELTWQGAGTWAVSTPRNTPDSTLISYPPLYVVTQHSPTRTGRERTVYYEVTIHRGSPSANVALGFTALPYPGFRLPGWHRGALAVHGDDGHKYINDLWGGKDFTTEFRSGDTYGLGMRIAPSMEAPHQASVHIFFTRNGMEVGGWNLHEETDAEQDRPVTGMEGAHDLCAAVGMFEGTELDVVFDPAKWKYRGVKNE